MLDTIDTIDWKALAQPKENRGDEVPKALRALSAATTEEAANRAYDRVLYAVGNNHAGTYFPVVVAAIPFLGEVLEYGAAPARIGTLDVLIDLMTSFEPEPGHEIIERPDGARVPLTQLLQTAVQALRPALKRVPTEDAVTPRLSELAAQLRQTLGEEEPH